MSDDTQVDIDISVNGTSSLTRAADAIAAVNSNLQSTARSLSATISSLDKLERSLAGVATGNNAVSRSGAAVARSLDTQDRAAKALAASIGKVYESTNNPSVGVTGPSIDATSPLGRQIANDRIDAQNASAAASARLLAQEQAAVARQTDIANRALAHNAVQLQLGRDAFGKVTAANNTFGTATEKSYNRMQLLNFALNENADNLPRMRYALYDVAFALGVVGAAITGATLATINMAVQFEKQFAEVKRTTGLSGDAAELLRQNLIDLSQTIPISFQQIATIAALGGQLGIANDDIENFTSTVAKFAATTDVTVDATATAFGRLDSLLDDVQGNFEALGSSIINVGINSVATESQIIAITSQIAASGSQAGLTADEIIGLAGALASLGVAPEAARGTILRVFSQINSAIAAGGQRLEDFGRISGKTGADFANGWDQDFTTTFITFLQGIDSQGVGAEASLRALGITATRDINTMLKLAQNFQDVGEYLGLANEGFTEASQLGANFEIIASTISSKLTTLANTFQSLIASIGESSLGPIGALLDLLNGIAQGLQNIVSNPVGQVFAGIAVAIGLVAGALTLAAAAAAVGSAGLLAFKTVAASTMITTLGLTGAVTALGTAIKVGLISTGIGAAVVIVGTLVAAILQLSGAFDTATDKAENYFGSIDSLVEALKRDQEAASESAKTYGILTSSVTGTDGAVSSLTFKIRENTAAWIANSLAADENVAAIMRDRELLASRGFDVDKFISLLATGGAKAGQAYIDAFKQKLLDAGELGDLQVVLDEAIGNLDEVASVYGAALQAAADEATIFDTVNQALGITIDGTGDSFEEATKQLLADVDAIYASRNAYQELEDSLGSLGEAFANRGSEAAASGSEIQAVIGNIIAASANTAGAANSLQGFFDALVAGGYASASQLILLQQVIASLGGATKATTFDLTPFTAGVSKAGGAAGGAGKKIRTLVDYANDLQKVFSRSFDLRFGNAKALDEVTSAWTDLNDQLTEYLIKLQKLEADKAIQEYFLSVANAYGDTLRAGELMAGIADINQQIAEAQIVTNKTLVGNSKAAIANRKVITDLVSDYQDYITALAESGASQGTLQSAVASSRQDFINQAIALGFSGAEVQNYAASFDDMAVAINKVPRNITVAFNPNPALQALNEFVAAATKAGGSAGAGFASGMQQGLSKAARGAELMTQLSILQGKLGQMMIASGGFFTPAAQGAAGQISLLAQRLKAGAYADGGAIHGPGTNTSDSIPIWASNNEFMFSARAVSSLGTPLLNYMNRYGRIPGFADGGSIGGANAIGSFGGIVELGPKSLGVMRQAINREVALYLDPMGIARLADKGHKQIAYGG